MCLAYGPLLVPHTEPIERVRTEATIPAAACQAPTMGDHEFGEMVQYFKWNYTSLCSPSVVSWGAQASINGVNEVDWDWQHAQSRERYAGL